MRSFLQNRHRFVFYSCWLLLGLVQARFTELWDDEAYYWVYSKFLDWGYFDHPPMVAVLIKAGYFVFQNELGVRIFFLLMNLFTLVIIEKLIAPKNPFLFYAILLSFAVLQLGGFLAVPDTPLIFFTALFFLVYRRFLEKASSVNGLALGLVMAALFYSKYHGLLIVLLIVISNLRLLTWRNSYIAGFIAVALFTPHLWWQYHHDWISFRYHLFESNVNSYRVSFTFDYLGGQILVAGPIAGIVLLPAAFRCRSKNSFEKGLIVTLYGIYIFFLLSSFRGKVEANWTAPAIVPLIILSYTFLAERISWQRWLFRLLPVTMVFVLFARIIMIADVLPVKAIRQQYHAWKTWPALMRAKTNATPVVFENSYQQASKYWFYSGQLSYSLNSYKSRRNNYDLWPIEDSLLGKPVFILDSHDPPSFPNIMQTGIGAIGFEYDSSFSGFAKVQFVCPTTMARTKQNAPVKLTIKPNVSEKYSNYIHSHPELNTKIVAGIFNRDGWVKDLTVPYPLIELIKQPTTLNLDPHLPPGDYYLIFSVFCPIANTGTHNSERIKLVIK